MEIDEQTIVDIGKIHKAMDQWIASQNIDPRMIGPVMVSYAVRDIVRICKGNPFRVIEGINLLFNIAANWAGYEMTKR